MKIPHVSASQIESFRNCKRLWYLQKVKKRRTPPTASQELGTEIHADLEAYLKEDGGHEFKHVERIKPVIKLLPAPSKDLLLEHEFWLPTTKNCPDMMGYMDLVDPRSISSGYIDIGDHKTTKNFKYAKTKKALKQNTQALVYARWGYQIPYLPWFPVPPTPLWRGIERAEKARFSHYYILTEGEPDAKKTEVEFHEKEVDEAWDGIVSDVEQMVVLAENDGKHHLKVEGNPKACYMYGGCPFKEDGTCSDMGFSKKTQGGELNMSALMEKLKARKATPETVLSVEPEMAAEAVGAEGIIPPDAPSREMSPGETVEEKGKKKRTKKEAAAEPARVGGYKWLFVGALSSTIGPLAEELGMIPVPMERWIRPYEQAICEEMGTADVGLIDFGKGKGALAALIAKMIEEAPKAVWTGDAMGRFTDIVAAAYIAAGHIVIKKT